MKRLQQLPGIEPFRIATGPARFGADWPGIFIRGDDALSYAHCLRTVLRRRGRGLKELGDIPEGMDHAAWMGLSDLLKLLNSARLGKRKTRRSSIAPTSSVTIREAPPSS